MTLNTTTTKVSYAGTGSQTSFPVTFKFLQNSHVTAILRDASGNETTWVEGTQYTLTGAGDESGGDLTVNTVPVDYTPQSGETLVIKRTPPETQGSALPLGGAFSSALIEEALDLLTMQVQAHSEEIARAVLLKATSAESGITIPDPEAAKVLRWDALAQNLENADVTGAGSIGIPVSVAQGGTSATTAAAARTALGLAIGTDVQADLEVPSQAEAEAGTATTERVWTAERIGQAIAALESGLPRSFLAGLELANNVADGDHDIDIAAGESRDDSNNADLFLAAALTKRIDAAWAVGDDAGGLDSGTVASGTWYHVWLIKRTDTGVVDALFSSSAASPAMPANYDKKRRIGAVLTDGSANIRRFWQRNNEFVWDVPVADLSNSSIGDVAPTTHTLSVPTGLSVIALFNASNGTNSITVLFWPPDQTGVKPNLTGPPIGQTGGNANDTANFIRCPTNTLGQVKAQANTPAPDCSISTLGWIDHRGWGS